MKHFLVELEYIVPFEQLADTVADHRQFLQGGFDRGILLLSGPKNPRTGGVVIARAESLDDLQSFFAGDPFVQKGFGRYRFVEFVPVKRQEFLKDWVGE